MPVMKKPADFGPFRGDELPMPGGMAVEGPMMRPPAESGRLIENMMDLILKHPGIGQLFARQAPKAGAVAAHLPPEFVAVGDEAAYNAVRGAMRPMMPGHGMYADLLRKLGGRGQ